MSDERNTLMQERLRDERALIYRNLLNGVPVFKVCESFHKSEPEVMQVFRYVTRKIKNYIFEKMLPPIYCDSISEAMRYKVQILQILPKLNLDKAPIYKDIGFDSIRADNFGHMERQIQQLGRK